MKRDMDLARLILFKLEHKKSIRQPLQIKLRNYSDDDVSYHIWLLFQGGLVQANDLSTISTFCWEATDLTWEGHEFIEAARNDNIWQSAKNVLKEKGVGISFDVLKQVLIQQAKNTIFGSSP